MFRIYYHNGKIFKGDNPAEAPKKGVQVIVEQFGDRRLQHSLGDYYGWNGEHWEANNIKNSSWLVTLEGLYIKTKHFKRIRAEAMEWLNSV